MIPTEAPTMQPQVKEQITRHYPLLCRSMYCGYTSSDDYCRNCSNRAELDDFIAWRERTGAVCADPIWSPTIYKIPAAS